MNPVFCTSYLNNLIRADNPFKYNWIAYLLTSNIFYPYSYLMISYGFSICNNSLNLSLLFLIKLTIVKHLELRSLLVLCNSSDVVSKMSPHKYTTSSMAYHVLTSLWYNSPKGYNYINYYYKLPSYDLLISLSSLSSSGNYTRCVSSLSISNWGYRLIIALIISRHAFLSYNDVVLRNVDSIYGTYYDNILMGMIGHTYINASTTWESLGLAILSR